MNVRNAHIVSGPRDYAAACHLYQALSDEGYAPQLLSVAADDAHTAETVTNKQEMWIIYLDQSDPVLMLHLGCLIGADQPLLLVTEPKAQLPHLLRRFPSVHSGEHDVTSQILQYLGKTTGLVAPDRPETSNPTTLLNWLAQDISRIDILDAHAFETVVAYLLHAIGLLRKDRPGHGFVDSVFRDESTQLSVFLQCKTYPFGSKVTIEDVRQAAADALPLACACALVVSPNDFTHAAISFSRCSVPPVWLISKDQLSSMIKLAIQSPSKKEKRALGLPFLFGSASPSWWSLHGHRYVVDRSRSSEPQSAEWGINFEAAALADESRGLGDWLTTHYEMLPNRRASRRSDCEVFIVAPEGRGDVLRGLLSTFQERDVRFWHDSQSDLGGHACSGLDEVVDGVSKCHIVLVVMNQKKTLSTFKMSVLQAVACEVEKVHSKHLVLVLGEDNLVSRLKLPEAFMRSFVIDPAAGSRWEKLIVSTCKQLAGDVTGGGKGDQLLAKEPE